MKILVCGDRNWASWKAIQKVLAAFPSDTVLCHGDCRGADKMSAYVARQLGWKVIPYPADWTKFGKRAGPIRNRQMFDSEQPDLVLAFHNNLAQSKGTADMVSYSESKGCEVCRITESNCDDQSRRAFDRLKVTASKLPELDQDA